MFVSYLSVCLSICLFVCLFVSLSVCLSVTTFVIEYSTFLNGFVVGFKHISGLGPSELISLSVIEQYMELKLGEVWREITNELAVEKFEPVAMDRELMEQVCR